MKPELRILSMGWGVQTWALAAMAAMRDIPPLDFTVFADTTHEGAATYEFKQEWEPWLRERGHNLVTVQGKRTDVVYQWVTGSKSVIIPAFTVSLEGNPGQIRRQCTREWKIAPIRTFIREELGRRGLKRRPGVVQSLQGISVDEFMRMKDSDVKYIVHDYPLVDMRMSRNDCKSYVRKLGLPVPPKSACAFCPFHNKQAWEDQMKEDGQDWHNSIGVDENIRHKRPGFVLYLHPSRKPLVEAVRDTGQMEFWPDEDCDSGYCFT